MELLTALDPAVRFDIANSVWARERVAFHQSFLDAVGEAFAAQAEARELGDPATVDAINAWVEEHTDGRIDEIVEQLDPFATLDSEPWNEIVAGLSPRTVDLVALPRLTLSFDAYLNDALIGMGMEPAFYPGANFTRMSPRGDDMCIDFVRQKTHLEVDEEGTRAAAVTAVGVKLLSFTGLIADRPFVIAIRERLSGTVVFVALLGDPTAEDPGAEPYHVTCK
jgi:serine protease inhibitor